MDSTAVSAPRKSLAVPVRAALLLKPGIAAGVSASAYAGMALAARGLPDGATAALCIASVMLAAMGAGLMNNILDARLDCVMARTSCRPQLLGLIGGKAAIASAALVAVSLALSLASPNALTAMLTLAAVAGYALLYTLYLKRRSPYGTVPGGIPGALPVLIGYSAVNPAIGPDGLMLFALMLLWQPPHFLALALRHRGEYVRAGIPVMPAVLGERYTRLFMLIYASALAPACMSLWLFGYLSGWFALFSLLVSLLFIAACWLELSARPRRGLAFGASIAYIMLVFAGIVVDLGV